MTAGVVANGGHPVGPEQVVVALPITLGQFLKLAGLAGTGGDAKQMIASGLVRVNGIVDTRRGRKLAAGDVVAAGGEQAQVMVAPASEAAQQAPESPGR